MRFIKFYFLLNIVISVVSMVDFLILGSALSVLVGTLELINLIFTVVAVFKIRKLKLSNMTKLFPIFVILLTLFIIILTVIFAGGAYELASNGSSIQKAVLATPYWILILDQVTYFIFMIWAINIFWKLKRIY